MTNRRNATGGRGNRVVISLYKKGEFVGVGTREELAKLTGLKVETFKSVNFRNSKTWSTEVIDVESEKERRECR